MATTAKGVVTTISAFPLLLVAHLWYNVGTMYIRTVSVKKTHKTFRYVQLCHNYRDPVTGVSKTKVLHNLGPADALDTEALRRLVNSISRYLEPDEAAEAQAIAGNIQPFEFKGSRELGGTWLLDGLWQRLGIRKVLETLLREREFATPIELLIFAMVANRALAPCSKLGLEHWVANKVHISGLDEVEVHQLYRAMDFLLEADEKIQHDVFFSVANLFNLEVDLIFVDTTNVYFEIEHTDEDVFGDDGELTREGLRKRGRNKQKRHDLAQVTIAFAITRSGIPVRCWSFPGNSCDQNLVEAVKKDLNDWQLGRVVMVMDSGFNSAANQRVLQGAGDHYIIGEKMRLGPGAEPAEALRRGGRYKKLANGLEIKEVLINEGSAAQRRFIVVRNPTEAKRDRLKRDDIVAEIERRLEALKQLEGEAHTKGTCKLRSHPTFGRYLRQNRAGVLSLDKAKIRKETQLDGKYLVSSSDDKLSAEDIVLGYLIGPLMELDNRTRCGKVWKKGVGSSPPPGEASENRVTPPSPLA